MKSQIFNRGGSTSQKVKKVTKPSSIYYSGSSTAPSKANIRHRWSFEPVGISEILGEPELRTNQVDTATIEIEVSQADEFARNFNSPLTDLNDLVIV